MNNFEQLGLSESLLKILDLGFENPTEVQEKAIPYYWKKKTQIWLRWSQTGTGKRQLWFSSYSEN
jgi:ATP-dependent RNA helicase DeaD